MKIPNLTKPLSQIKPGTIFKYRRNYYLLTKDTNCPLPSVTALKLKDLTLETIPSIQCVFTCGTLKDWVIE